MSGLMGTFNIAKGGMAAQQYAIKTASHNIANANTDGFSRQRVNLETSLPYSYNGVGQIGTGVDINSISRIRDGYLDVQIRQENSIESKFKSEYEILEQSEIVFLEPSENGLNKMMNETWNAWQGLSENPESINARTIVVESTNTFTDSINQMTKQLDILGKDTLELMKNEVGDINEILSQVNELNNQIHKIELKNLEANDLLDKRDKLVDELSTIMEINIETDEFSRIQITQKGTDPAMELLPFNYKESPKVEITLVQGELCYKDNDGNLTKADIKNGALAGNQAALEKIEDYKNEVDYLAATIATGINKIHGAPPFFETSDGSADFNGANIKINQVIADDPMLVNAGKELDSPKGDGSRAAAISRLRDSMVLSGDIEEYKAYIEANYDESSMSIESSENGVTFEDYYKNIVAKVGIDTKSAKRGFENQEVLVEQLSQRRESISGVSIDEEVANIIQFKASFQANAKVMSTLTEMLDTIINRLGA